jgi:hypothetical protein
MQSPSALPLPFSFRKPRAKPVYKGHAKFTPEEDFRLYRLVMDHGPNNWRLIARYMPERNSRQCRERWLNYLNPELNVQPWTPAEDALLQAKYREIGPRWMLLVPFFPRRTDGMIKNRFQILRRKARRSQILSPVAQAVSRREVDLFDCPTDGSTDWEFEPLVCSDGRWKGDSDGLF